MEQQFTKEELSDIEFSLVKQVQYFENKVARNNFEPFKRSLLNLKKLLEKVRQI